MNWAGCFVLSSFGWAFGYPLKPQDPAAAAARRIWGREREEGGVRKREEARVWLDLRAIIICSNLKYWKVSWKKSCGRWIGFLPFHRIRVFSGAASSIPFLRPTVSAQSFACGLLFPFFRFYVPRQQYCFFSIKQIYSFVCLEATIFFIKIYYVPS